MIAEAIERSPALAAIRARRTASREGIAPAGALPDPTAAVRWTDAGFPPATIGSEPMSSVAVSVEQMLPGPGKRRAAREAAASDILVRDREIAALECQLAAEVRSLYARLYAIDSERESLAAARELVDLLAATAAVRYGVGETAQEPVIRAQLEATRLDERLDDLRADRRVAVASLNRLLDRPAGASLGPVAALPPAPAPPPDADARAVALAPTLGIGEAEVTAAERRVAVARSNLKPDYFVGSEVGIRGGLPPVLMVMAGVNWPWRKDQRQRPLVRAAEADLAAAREDVRDRRLAVRSEVARLAAEWERDDGQARRYREAILPQAGAAMNAARTAYLAGRGDFSTVVEDFRAWLDARVELARREAGRYLAWAGLHLLISPTPASDAPEGSAR